MGTLDMAGMAGIHNHQNHHKMAVGRTRLRPIIHQPSHLKMVIQSPTSGPAFDKDVCMRAYGLPPFSILYPLPLYAFITVLAWANTHAREADSNKQEHGIPCSCSKHI